MACEKCTVTGIIDINHKNTSSCIRAIAVVWQCPDSIIHVRQLTMHKINLFATRFVERYTKFDPI